MPPVLPFVAPAVLILGLVVPTAPIPASSRLVALKAAGLDITEVQAGNKTWGQLLDGLGIEPGMIEGEIRKMLQGDGSAAKS
jgi:hypothetical protein